jgi:hypothetical protein
MKPDCGVVSCDKPATVYVSMPGDAWGEHFCDEHQHYGLVLCNPGAVVAPVGA